MAVVPYYLVLRVLETEGRERVCSVLTGQDVQSERCGDPFRADIRFHVVRKIVRVGEGYVEMTEKEI